MVRTTVVSIVILATSLVAGAAAAQDLKICTVDLQGALASVEEGREAYEQLTGELQRRQVEINAQREELEAWMEEAQTQMAVLSPEEREARVAEYEERASALQEAFQAHQEQLGRAEMEATQRIASRMMEIVEELAASQDCSVVLQASALLYAPDALDFTEELVTVYNARH